MFELAHLEFLIGVDGVEADTSSQRPRRSVKPIVGGGLLRVLDKFDPAMLSLVTLGVFDRGIVCTDILGLK